MPTSEDPILPSPRRRAGGRVCALRTPGREAGVAAAPGPHRGRGDELSLEGGAGGGVGGGEVISAMGRQRFESPWGQNRK